MKKLRMMSVLAAMAVMSLVLVACGGNETKYAVTWNTPAVIAFTVKAGETTITSGDTVKKGTVVTVTWTDEANYPYTVAVGTTNIVNGGTYKVNAATEFVATKGAYIPTSTAVTTGFTVHTWTTGDPDVGVETDNWEDVDGTIVVSVAEGTKFIQLDIKDFLAENEVATVTRGGNEAAIYELVAANGYNGNETWRLAGDIEDETGKTLQEMKDDETYVSGSIFVYPDQATWIYFGINTDDNGFVDLAGGETYKVVFTAANGDTYTLNLAIAIDTTAVVDGFTVHTWTTGDPDVGVETSNWEDVDGTIVVTVANGTKFIQLDIKEFLADNEVATVTRGGNEAAIYELVAANGYNGNETWKLAGTDDEVGKTLQEMQDDETYVPGSIFVYPDQATWIYFGINVEEGAFLDLEGGETYKVVFTAAIGETYTLKIAIEIA